MSGFDEDRARPVPTHQIGQDLSLLSVEELHTRIAQLRTEINRLEMELSAKGNSKQAAEDLFRKS